MRYSFFHLLSIICLGCSSIESFAQKYQPKIDSLKQVLSKELSQQERANTYGTLGAFYQKQKKASLALGAYQEALKHVDTLKASTELANLYKSIGDVYYGETHYKKTLNSYFKSLAVKQKLGNQGQVGILLFNIGIVFRDANNYPKAVEYYQKALEIFLHDKKTYKYSINVYQNLGIVQRQMGNFDKAIAQHQKVVEVSKKLKFKVWVAHGQNGLGNAYFQQGKYQQALEYYQQALKYYRTAKNKVNLATCEANIVNIYLRQGNPKAEEYMLRSLEIFKQYKLRGHEAKVYNDFGKSYRIKGQYDKALFYYQKNLKIRKQLKYKKGIAVTLRLMGAVYQLQGRYDKARECFQEGLTISKKIGDNTEQAIILEYIGRWHLRKGNYVEALQNYQKALYINEKNNRIEGLYSVYQALSRLYNTQGTFTKSLSFVKKGLEINTQNQRPLGAALNNVAHGYYQVGNYEQALKYYDQALSEEMVTQRQAVLATIYHGLGLTHMAQGQYLKAQTHLLRTLKIRQMLGEKENQALIEVALGELKYHQHQYEEALQYLRSAVDIAQRLNLPAVLKEGSRYLAKVYAALGNYKEAYQSHTLYKTLADSLVNQKNTRKIAQLETQYVYQQKQDSLKVIQAKKEGVLQTEIQTQKANQRTVLIGAGFLGLLLVVLALFYRSKQRSNRLLTSTNAQLISLDRFKQQMMGMIVHDLKNPLNAIIGLSEDQQNPQFTPINRSGKRMQHLVLNILDVQRMEDQKMPLKKEIVAVDDLIQGAMNQVSFVVQEKNQQIKFTNLPEAASLEGDTGVLTRVLVNLLINATQHTTHNQAIQVTTEVGNDRCKISVIDEGAGIAPEFLDKLFDQYQQATPKQFGWTQSTGLGLTFCKLAVEAHQGEIGVTSTLGKGSTFWFTLPLAKTTTATPSVMDVPKNVEKVSDVFFQFTPTELKVLQPLVIKISQYQIYQTGDIIPLLDTLTPTNSEAIKNWQLAMKDAIFAYNKTTFETLLELASTHSSTI
ncbi:MAG TPA: hypothetical protein DCS93_14265 [Microscillaceae bacterium]|nr:hypothetical protein [Microscillaceae bacterium]